MPYSNQLPRPKYCANTPFLSLFLTLVLLARPVAAGAQRLGPVPAIYSGVPWFDDRGQVVSAHGANLVREQGHYYLFGEAYSNTSNVFAGFNCYSSPDLYTWKFERVAHPLRPQPANWARSGWANAPRC